MSIGSISNRFQDFFSSELTSRHGVQLEVLSGLEDENLNKPIISSPSPFFEFLEGLYNDRQSDARLSFQAGRLLFYFHDKPQFRRQLDIFRKTPGAYGLFWQQAVDKFMPSLADNVFTDVIAKAKGWNVNRGLKKIHYFEDKLTHATTDKERAKWQAKLDDQHKRQSRREESFNDWASDSVKEAVAQKYNWSAEPLSPYFAPANSVSSAPSGGFDWLSSNMNMGYTPPKLSLPSFANNSNQSLFPSSSSSATSTPSPSSSISGEVKKGGSFDWGNLTSSLINVAGGITKSVIDSNTAQAIAGSRASGQGLPTPSRAGAAFSAFSQHLPSLVQSLPSTNNNIVDKAIQAASRGVQAVGTAFAPPMPQYSSQYTSPASQYTSSPVSIPAQVGKAGFDTKKMLMLGGGILGVGLLAFLLTRKNGRGLSGIETSNDTQEKFKVLPLS